MTLTSQGKEAFINFIKQAYPSTDYSWDETTTEDEEFQIKSIVITDGTNVQCEVVIYYTDEMPNFYYAGILNDPENKEDDR